MGEPLRLELTTPPAIQPVSLDEAKAHLRVEAAQSGEDALIQALLAAASARCEAFTGRALITQTWTLRRDRWPSGPADEDLREGLSEGVAEHDGPRALPLPKAPLQAVVHVKTFDEADAETVWPAASYLVDTASEPGRLIARSGQSFPLPSRAGNGIEVRFTAGYGASASAVPEPLRQGILRLTAFLFENRGDGPPAPALEACGAAALWRPYVLPRL